MTISDDPIILRDEVALLGDYVAPTTPEERMITAIWARVLRIDRVGINDNYFDINGDSLSAATLVIEVEERFSIKLNLAAILDKASTVAGMARLVAAERGKLVAKGPSQSTSATCDQGLNAAPQADFGSPVARKLRLIDGRDVYNTIVFSVLFAVAGLGVRHARWMSRLIARLHITLRGSLTDRFREASLALNAKVEPLHLEQGKLADVYIEIFYTMREYFSGGWRPHIDLEGGEHIDQALEQGQGAVLWISTSDCGGLAMLKALSEAGHAPVFLSSDIHPYSGTAYGRRVLNPIRTRAENRYLSERVFLADGEEASTMQQLREQLQANRVVAIAAIAAADNPMEIPFLGGTLRLALGAATLAVLGGTVLLPVFVVPTVNGGFKVHVEPPLQNEFVDGEKPKPEQLAVGYAKRLKSFVQRHPTVWGGWSNESQWHPE